MTYDKNQVLEEYLRDMASALQPSEEKLLEDLSGAGSELPTVIKIGSPRVGGTLLTQWASSGNLFYNPTNLHSRFYAVPVVGALLNRLLSDPDLDYRDEFGDLNREVKYGSSIGKTNGVLAPHEFWYFWRHFLHITDVPSKADVFLEKSDFDRFGRSIQGIQKIQGKSLFLKGHLVNFLLEPFHSRINNVVYFHLKRSIIDTARSLYRARVEWTGSEQNWFSHKPPEYEELRLMDPYHQVIGQIYFIEREIHRVAPLLGAAYYSVDYEAFCGEPAKVYSQICEVMNSKSTERLSSEYWGPTEFIASKKSSPELDGELMKALDYFMEKYGEIDLYGHA